MIRNVHERTIEAPADRVGELFDRLGGPDDRIWPRAWTPMRLDRPLRVGADGGHGSVRYGVIEHDPGRRVCFLFRPETGIDGFHEFSVEPLGEERCRVRHILLGRPMGAMKIIGLAVVTLHDALLEDLLDNLEREVTGTVRSPAAWSFGTRVWRVLIEHRELRQDAREHGPARPEAQPA